MGQLPFVVNLGYYPNTSKNINLSTKNSLGMEQFLKTIEEIRNGVELALKKTNETMKRKWDLKRKPAWSETVEWRFSIGRHSTLQHRLTLQETVSQMIGTISYNMESQQISLWTQDSTHMEVYPFCHQWVLSYFLCNIHIWATITEIW